MPKSRQPGRSARKCGLVWRHSSPQIKWRWSSPRGLRRLSVPRPERFKGALICGPNWELLNRLKNQAVRNFVSSHPDGEVVRFSDPDLVADAGRLLEELQSISMFGADKLVLVDAASSTVHKACISAISVGWSDCLLLVTAGDLKKSSPLRKEFEASPDWPFQCVLTKAPLNCASSPPLSCPGSAWPLIGMRLTW